MSITEALLGTVEMHGTESVLDDHRENINKALVLLKVSVASKNPLMDPERLAAGVRLMVDALHALGTAVSDSTAAEGAPFVDLGVDPRAFLVEQADKMRDMYNQRINDILTGAQEARENAHTDGI